jgi:hypothetical protein
MNKTINAISLPVISYVHDDGSQKTWTVDPTCKVTLDGQPSTLDALKVGDKVEFSGQPATSLVAERPLTAAPTAQATTQSHAQPTTPYHGGIYMAKPTVTISKRSSGTRKAAPGAKATGTAFVLQDNQDDTCTVQGVDAAGAAVDISGVAVITVSSDNLNVLTVDPPTGMTFRMRGVAPGSATVSVQATWNDGSIGPFQFVLPVTVTGSAATGIVVTPGTPSVR